MGEKRLGYSKGAKSTLFVVRCISSSSKYLSIFTAQRIYRWRKRETIVRDHSILEEFCEAPLEDMIHLQ